MHEGVEFITQKEEYRYFDPESGLNKTTGTYYSFNMILSALEDRRLQRQFFEMLVFDYIIGNTDRHQNNWAVIKRKYGKPNIVLYDNGSSLCSLVPENKINNYLGNDKSALESLIVNKSETLIRINEKSKKKEKHINVIKFLKDNYYKRTYQFVRKVVLLLNDKKLNEILDEVNEYISEERRKLILIFLKRKIKDLKEIYEK